MKARHYHKILKIGLVMLVLTLLVGTLTACGEKEPETQEVDVFLLVQEGEEPTSDSTPSIMHIESKDHGEVDFYHAITTEEIEDYPVFDLLPGKYELTVIAPANSDGSIYSLSGKEVEIKTSSTMPFDVSEDGGISLNMSLTKIPAEEVTDEMTSSLLKKTEEAIQDAAEKGDESLQGENGEKILEQVKEYLQK